MMPLNRPHTDQKAIVADYCGKMRQIERRFTILAVQIAQGRNMLVEIEKSNQGVYRDLSEAFDATSHTENFLKTYFGP